MSNPLRVGSFRWWFVVRSRTRALVAVCLLALSGAAVLTLIRRWAGERGAGTDLRNAMPVPSAGRQEDRIPLS